MKWAAPEYRAPGSEKESIRVPRVSLRLAPPARKTPLVGQVGCSSQTCSLYERDSVLVITMSFHSRGILDVVAPVREVERDPLPR